MQIKLNRNEVLRYCSVKTDFDNLENGLKNKFLSIIKFCEDNYNFSFCHRIFDIEKHENHIDVCKTQLKLFGNDIKNHLKDCDKCILLALSLGTWADRTCAKYSALSQTDSLIFDGCMTELIEQLADQTCFQLQKQYGAITSRFGPGYGDLPLNIQKSFINIIGADKKMGITVVNNLMIPLKTITAVIGIYNKDKIEQKNIKLKKCINKCDSCENKCEFYKP